MGPRKTHTKYFWGRIWPKVASIGVCICVWFVYGEYLTLQIEVQRISSAPKWYTSPKAHCTSLSRALHSPLKYIMLYLQRIALHMKYTDYAASYIIHCSTLCALHIHSVLHFIWSILISLRTLHALPLKCLIPTLKHIALRCSSVFSAYALQRSCSALKYCTAGALPMHCWCAAFRSGI